MENEMVFKSSLVLLEHPTPAAELTHPLAKDIP